MKPSALLEIARVLTQGHIKSIFKGKILGEGVEERECFRMKQ
jgi:hypothetical protein